MRKPIMGGGREAEALSVFGRSVEVANLPAFHTF